MKKLKIFGLAALMAISLTSCGSGGNGGNEDEKIAKEAINVISVQNQISSYEIQLPALIQVNKGSEKVSVNVTWEGTPAARWNFRYETTTCFAEITLPDANKDEAAVEFTLKATGTYNGATATREFSGYLMPTAVTPPTEDSIMTVAEAIEAEDGDIVTIRGITASARNGEKGFFVVDETGAIYVYDQKAQAINSFKYGNEVQITATRGANNGAYNKSSVQLVYDADSSISLKSSEVKAIPTAGAKALTCPEFASWKKDGSEDYSGGFYKVTAKLAKYSPGSYTTYEVMDDNGKYIQLYASDGSVYDTEFAEYFVEDNIVVDGTTTKTKANYNIYLAVYDAKIDNGAIKSWRVAPLLVEAAA